MLLACPRPRLLCLLLTGALWLCPALLLAASSNQRWAQLSDSVFQHLTTEQGLPNLATVSLAQDQHGFLWVGTQSGLARWDGYRFRNYQPAVNDRTSLPDNIIRVLHTDPQGQLWIGTNTGGLARYDAAHDRFERFPVGPKGSSSSTIFAIVDDGLGGIWVGTRTGLDHFRADGQIKHLRHDPANPESVPSGKITTLLRDHNGQLWIGSAQGLARQQGQSERFERLPWPNAPVVRSLAQSRNGRIWIGTESQGIWYLDPAIDAAPEQPQQPGLPRPLKTAADPDSSNPNRSQGIISTIVEARPGEVWIGSFGNGILAVDTTTLQSHRIVHDAALPVSVADNVIMNLLRDRSGLLWIATQRGISRTTPGQSAVLSLFSGVSRPGHIVGSDILSTSVMPDGRIWLGMRNGGINIISAAADQISWHAPDFAPNSAKNPLAGVYASHTWHDGSVFLATGSGLYRTNLNATRLQRISAPPRAETARVTTLLADGKRLWLGGPDGLWYIEPERTDSPALRAPGASALDNVFILSMERQADGTLWIGTHDSGIFRYHPASQQLLHMAARPDDSNALSHDLIASMLFDQRGRLWIATQGGGINLLEQPGASQPGPFRHLNTAHGLQNNMVNKLLEDEQGQIWASTDTGLAVIDPQTLQIRILDQADGVAIQGYYANVGARTAAGELLFAGAAGLTVVRPERLQPWQMSPPLVVTEVRLGSRSINANSLNPSFVTNAAHPQKTDPLLTLRPDANNMTLEFSALDFSAPQHNQYAYRLDGYDTNWINTDPSRRNVTYTNLPPGDYRLRLRGSNRNGVWSEHELNLPVRVLPAWHQSWWFRLLGLLGISGAVIALVQVRTRYLRRRQLELELQVQQRTAALRQAQAQLVQQEKIGALGALVAGVAHEINTPLGTALMAISGANHVWQRLREAMAGERMSKSELQAATDEGSEFTALAMRTATRAAEMINSFKSIAVPFESEHRVDLDLALYLPEIAMPVRARLEQAGHSLKIEVESGLVLHTVAEALTEALNRILANVADHACPPASGSGSVPICMRILAYTTRPNMSASETPEVVISVSDNGVGIDEAALPKVFDPFFTTRSGTGGHIGLGLHVAFNHITQRLGGKLGIVSKPGQGTTVTIRLPLR